MTMRMGLRVMGALGGAGGQMGRAHWEGTGRWKEGDEALGSLVVGPCEEDCLVFHHIGTTLATGGSNVVKEGRRTVQ